MEAIAIIFIVAVVVIDILKSIKKYQMEGRGCLGAVIRVIIDIVLSLFIMYLVVTFLG